MIQISLFFHPDLSDEHKLLCQRFWKDCDINSYADILIQTRLLQKSFKLEKIDEVFTTLANCYVYDTNHQCEVCKRHRRIYYPYELTTINHIDTWRCEDCIFIVS